MSKDGLVASFDALAGRRPETVVIASPSRRATAASIDALARAIAERFPVAGVVPPHPAVLRAANGPGFLATLVALLRAGVPAALVDVAASAAETERIARALGAGVSVEIGTPWPEGPDAVRFESFALDGTEARVAPPPATVAVIKTTSGSTGQPKGIGVSSAALLADDAAIRSSMGIGLDDRLLASVPFSHSYGLSSLVVPALAHGIPLVLPDRAGAFEPLASAGPLGVTVFPTVPAWVAAWIRLSEPPPLPETLRTILSAGAPLSPGTAARFREIHGRSIHVFYGASECGGIAYDREGGAAERGTVGAPLDGVRVRLETEADGTAAGRVVVESPAVAETYLPDPRADLAGGRFRSADRAEFRNGEIALLGRADRRINVKGRKVDPREVERVIGEMDGVVEVFVDGVSREDAGDHVLRALIVCDRGGPDPEAVRAWCRSHLSESETPRRIVRVAALPRDGRGKIDVRAIAAGRYVGASEAPHGA